MSASGNDEGESSTDSAKMVLWRGNSVPADEAKALRHVFDNLQDHFGHQRPDPKIKFSANLERQGPSLKWVGDLDFTYNINGDFCRIAYIGMDVCVDLCPKLIHRRGQPMLEEYGKTWVYVYLPQLTFEKVLHYVKHGTGYDVSDQGTIDDPNRNLVAIEAKMHCEPGEPKPSFWVLKENEKCAEDMSFSRLGCVQEVNAQSQHQHIHRGVGIFSVSMEVEGSPCPNDPSKPYPREGDEANLTFTLVSARTWGVTDCVAHIVHAPNKWHESERDDNRR